jgi:hypothetical protein
MPHQTPQKTGKLGCTKAEADGTLKSSGDRPVRGTMKGVMPGGGGVRDYDTLNI